MASAKAENSNCCAVMPSAKQHRDNSRGYSFDLLCDGWLCCKAHWLWLQNPLLLQVHKLQPYVRGALHDTSNMEDHQENTGHCSSECKIYIRFAFTVSDWSTSLDLRWSFNGCLGEQHAEGNIQQPQKALFSFPTRIFALSSSSRDPSNCWLQVVGHKSINYFSDAAVGVYGTVKRQSSSSRFVLCLF